MTRIVVDAMGSDEYPVPDVTGAVMAAREYGVEIILVGDEALIRPVLEAQKPGTLPIRVVHAPEMLTMEDKGEKLAFKARHKDAQNSMAVGMDLVKAGQADAFVTAGNTGAGMVTALFRLGRLRGVDRPAVAPVFPTATGTCVVLDIGANPDCKPENLLQFAIMGSAYAEKVRGVKSPKVGLVSNGEEEGKGNELVRASKSPAEEVRAQLLWQRGGQGGHRRQGGCGRDRRVCRQRDAKDSRGRWQIDP